jgi:ABC-type multidrug transport system fused ATPase/permease subunit
VLNKLSFKIEDKEKVGIVGRTGAGKSTICLAVPRIVEIFDGMIMIDGVNIGDLDINYVRKNVTVIPQDPSLFKNSVKYNLDPSNQYPEERLLELLNKSGLSAIMEEKCKKKEGGKDTSILELPIEEGGSNLSSGERQLLCIVRAILAKNKIVILDEATANIDLRTEEIIQDLITNEFKDCTVITIAHRLQTIMSSDRVMVLSFGKVKEFEAP